MNETLTALELWGLDLPPYSFKQAAMPDKRTIHVPGLKSIGPYSQAVRAAGLLFVSGQPGVDPSTGEAAGLTFDVQARQAFRNLDAVLRAGGSRLDLVVNTTVLVADVSNFAELNRLFAEFSPENPPARMTMPVPLPKRLVSLIGCVATTEDISTPGESGPGGRSTTRA
jgi:2-iminobutanoate/2-iminopropanoate deaminase